MRFGLVFLLAIFLGPFAFADPQQDFDALMRSKNFDGALAALDEWSKAESSNPEIVVDYVNLYFSKSTSYGYSLDDFNGQDNGSSGKTLSFQDPKTGKTFYFNKKTFYSSDDIENAMKHFDDGISRFPDRLDIRFGKIYVLNTIQDYPRAAAALADTLTAAVSRRGAWLWSKNQPYPKDVSGFLGDVQNYYNLWYQSQTETGLEAMKTSCLVQIKAFPDHSWAYDDLALYYAAKRDADNQLAMLLKAHELAPADPVNLNNIAHFYAEKGNKDLALQYYQKVLDTHDQQFGKQAEKMMRLLNEK